MTIPDSIIKLNNNDPMRRAAAGELLKVGAPAIEPLILALQEKPWNVRFSARWVLGRLGSDAINPLIQAMSSSNNQDVLEGAASALGDIGDNRAVDVLIKSIGHQNLRLSEFRIALGKLKDERAIPALILDLESNSLSRNEATIDALISFGTSAIDPLIHELDVKGKFRCLSAALALGKLKAVDAIDPLIMILRDSTTDDPLYDALLPKQKQLGISSAAATALGLIGGSRVILPLISATKDKREKVRKCAIDALGETSDSRVFDILIEVLGDTSDEVRRAAISALGKLGDPRGIEPILNLLIKGNDKEKTCASSAIRNLLISHSDGRVIPVLKKLYKESPNIQVNTGVALGLAGDQEIRDICINNLREGNNINSSIRILGDLREANAVPFLTNYLKDQDYFRRANVAEVLGLIKDERAVDALVEAVLTDTSSLVRPIAIHALGEIASPRAFDPILSCITGVELYEATVALSKIGDPRAIIPLISLITELAWSIGDNYVNAFIKFGPSTKATLWPLLTDKRWDIRYFAVSVLGKLDDNEVVQSLSKLANDENIHVRDAVSIALPSDLR